VRRALFPVFKVLSRWLFILRISKFPWRTDYFISL
jgi:hypothetical protein